VTHPSNLSTSSADLVARIRGGDARAFEELFRREYVALCRFADRYVRDAPASEDLVQDLFATLWANRARLDVRGSLRAYLFTAARNRALNARKHALVERDWVRDESAPEVRALHRAPRRPDDILDESERSARLRGAIAHLPERCRLVMQLRWQEQMAHADIAAIMGISIKGVEMQLARGLRALRERFRREPR
jgi:RNA polymerase sigma-70 factor (ECF subfamily)